jgi:glycerol-3-phosphate O-acyltransferase
MPLPTPPLQEEINAFVKRGKIPSFVAEIISHFYKTYLEAASLNGWNPHDLQPLLAQLLFLAAKQIAHPYRFEPYHKRLLAPFNYYRFATDFIRPLVQLEDSKVFGLETLDEIEKRVACKENVVLFANHQIEPDPQVISILLEKTHPKLAEEMIFVAGHRVTTDPLAVPFSLGCNLCCIYSKKYVEKPPELKAEKMIHNQRTIKKMVSLLKEGGHCIWIVPSGGRDRPDPYGNVIPAPLDPVSIDLFLLLAKQAKTPTHFHTLAMYTYPILPPPNTVENQIGEKRKAGSSPAFLSFGPKIDLEKGLDPSLSKEERSGKRASLIWEELNAYYQIITGNHP